ncbi:MAG: PH domain-containing protein [Candidatus Pacebacteria bacterium]|nr:PH domain-containing protein [Candidatus Paceibacterota bacterium]
MGNEQNLGIRVLLLYLCQNLMFGFVLLAISAGLLFFQDLIISKSFLLPSLGSIESILDFLIKASFVVSLFAILIGAEISWLLYVDTTFCLGEDAFTIKRGILSKTQISIPYRQIQDVYLSQSLLQRILGVSRLVVLTGGDDENDKEGESAGIFEIIDAVTAESLKEIILERSNIQKVVEITKK